MTIVDTDKKQRLLYTWPDGQSFGPKDEAKLAQKLEEIDEATGVEPISSLRMVQLDDYGHTLWGKYRLTVTAFSALALAAAPGLSKLIPNLVGMHRRAEQPREYFSFEKGVRVYNTIMDLRFDEISKKRYVLNKRDRIIEGVLGPKYRFLDNSTYYQLALEVVKGSAIPTQFVNARLAGRQLSLRFRQTKPVFNVDSDQYYAGFYFSNTEMGGAAIKAGVTIERGKTGYSCFQEIGRVAHKGKDFKARLRLLLARVLDRADQLGKLEEKARWLKSVSLELEVKEDDRRRRVKELTDRFRNKGLRQTVASRIVKTAMYQGSNEDEPYRRLTKAVLKSRTGYDLFNAAMREAVNLPIELQEQVEGAAYALLSGKFSLK